MRGHPAASHECSAVPLLNTCCDRREAEALQRAEFAADPGIADRWMNTIKVEKKSRGTLDAPLNWVTLDHKGLSPTEVRHRKKIWG